MGQAAQSAKDAGEEGSPPVTMKLKISEPLDRFPAHIFDLADSLEHLDLSGTGLSSLPWYIGRLRKLRIAFFSNCNFGVFLRELASCPALEMVAFRGNGMTEVPEDSLPPRLRWLILTDNRIRSLPESIGRCSRLQKCMLAGNELRDLPAGMASCERLGLLRLSANRIRELPAWLFGLPELAFLSFAGNPCSGTAVVPAAAELARTSWGSIQVHELLGEGASGVISRGTWDAPDQPRQVAVKLFKGEVTSDGTPADEMRACIQAGSHANLIDPLAQIHDHPDNAKGLVMQLIPTAYRTLGLPPSLQSCTRDCFPATTTLTTAQGLSILRGIASAATHLHGRGVAHGDLYAHNILVNEEGHSLLGDFGAASIYHASRHQHMEQIEVLAFAHLIEDIRRLLRPEFNKSELGVLVELVALHRRCSSPIVSERPRFSEVCYQLGEIGRYLEGEAPTALA
ncbi:hypothetical protein DL769_003145 [Monosporascus sp. CRB-8-3]|nr:hypothetical protein DL769_003145 [Monosporascus sp. CRB-8-3]